MLWVKQSTAVILKLGPFVDSTDAVTPETALSIAQADIQISKNGGAFAQTSDASPTTTHDADGWYPIPLTATDTNTLGTIKVQVAMAGALPVWAECMVLPAVTYDSLVAGSDTLDVNITSISGGGAAADALEAVFDGTGSLAAGLGLMESFELFGFVLYHGEIGTVTSQTEFTITGGEESVDDDAYNNALAVIVDSANTKQKAVGLVSDYTGSTQTLFLASDPGIFTIASGDMVLLLPLPSSIGSVTGNVGGNVVGSVASVTGSVGSLGTQAKADVNAEADTAIADAALATAANLSTANTNLSTLLTRLTSARAGYMDNLNVGGPVAAQSDIDAINQSASRRILITTVGQFERPESGSTVYTVEARTFDADGAAVNADSTPTLTATGQTTGSLAANVGTATNPATGVYRWTYTISSGDTIEPIRFDVSATISSSAFTLSAYSQAVDFVSATWTTADANNLTAIFNKLPSKSYLAGSNNSDGDIELNESTGDFNATQQTRLQTQAAAAITAASLATAANVSTAESNIRGVDSDTLKTLSDQLDTVTADTNELQTDWTNGGRLDLILDELTTQGDTNQSKLDSLLTRVSSTLFTGITSLAEWLGLLAGKQVGDATARTELRATGAGSGTFDETTDSLEAIVDAGAAGLTQQQVRDAMKLAPTAGTPAAGSIDEHLDDILEDTGTTLPAAISAIDVGAGSGARTITVTVDDGTDPLQGATVRLTEGVNTYSLTTDANGQGTFNVDDATYTVAITKAGYTYAGTTLAVTGDATPTYSMSVVAISPSAAADTVTAYGYTRDTELAIEVSQVVYFRLITAPSGNGDILDGAEFSKTSDGTTGLVQLTMIKGGVYETRRAGQKWQQITIPTTADDPYELPNIL